VTQTILLVEDNNHILKVNQAMLERAGYRTMTAANLAGARAAIKTKAPDLLVLDIMLPDGNGIEFCRELRAIGGGLQALPVLFLSAKNQSEDIVDGLRAGGDDYLPKPYDIRVLIARVEALLRRAGQGAKAGSGASAVKLGPLTLDTAAMRAFLRGCDLALTPREFAILLALARAEGKPVSAACLYQMAWGMGANDDVRAVRTHVSRIRAKLGGRAGGDFIIETDYGRGYALIKLR
jgi:DNA-binding response OmpR family regulator